MPKIFCIRPDTDQRFQILDQKELWGRKLILLLEPESGQVCWLDAEHIQTETPSVQSMDSHYLKYLVAASRVADAMTHNQLLSPLEASVIPLPHQLNALNRVIQAPEVRFLLADEVGLGKTIEAGLIMRELRLRGLIRRILIVVPAGLMRQWQSELELHFNEKFLLLEKIRDSSAAFWLAHDQVICSMDAIKPSKSGRNQHLEGLLEAGWDLVIVDEAHRLGGSSATVARYQLGRALAETVPSLLLLSATPHQGNTEAFCRLLSLLDSRFSKLQAFKPEDVRPLVIRTEKRQAIDTQGKKLFQPRLTEALVVRYSSESHRQLYEAVSQYVRQSYDQAIREKRQEVGFLLILMQRLVSSSTRAICETLEKRLKAIQPGGVQMPLFAGFEKGDPSWHELDSQSLLDQWLQAGEDRDEKREVQLLLQMARECSFEPDEKAKALYDLILKLRREESDPDLKFLIFTEFIATQEMLFSFLEDRGILALKLRGEMNSRLRQHTQECFASDYDVLISTDAGGEGLNLQFCHIVINYDIPWNPMKLEQRIGRVDRIGQAHPVRAFNFFLENSVEDRVREVLEDKLNTILTEFGVDKTADVLDSAEAGEWFDSLYVDGILQPRDLEHKARELAEKFRNQAAQSRDSSRILATAAPPDPGLAARVLESPVQTWIEQMVISQLLSQDCQVGSSKQNIWHLHWPDGQEMKQVVFTARDALRHPEARYLTLEESQVRVLLEQLPVWQPGQPVPAVRLQDWTVPGYWSLWEIGTENQARDNWRQRRLLSLFVDPDFKVLNATASRIWNEFYDRLLSELSESLDSAASQALFEQLHPLAEAQGSGLWQLLENEHSRKLADQRRRAEASWRLRERRIRQFNRDEEQTLALERLQAEKQRTETSLVLRQQLIPRLEARLLVKVL
ncbi:MAG: helicase [Candidatus Melainabacteria bacterium HGW-Melainabacteria-1]|nr:MAG: helicase [Candidatus Melainabacteria bacterium HGW-Melainabacteria-1]